MQLKMKPKNNRNRKFLLGGLIVFMIPILSFYLYINSNYRAKIEHGIDLPTHYSELETYGSYWQFWKSCGRHSSTFFVIPKEEYDGYMSQFKVLMESSFDSMSTNVIPGMQDYLEERGEGFRVTSHVFIESKKTGFHQEIYTIENTKKLILGFWTMLTNPCD